MGQPVVESRIKGSHQESKCTHCGALLEYFPPEPQTSSTFLIRCAKCSNTFSASSNSQSSSKSQPSSKSQAVKSRSRKIGTDDDPIDMTYYEVLGVSHKANLQEIKSAYRRLAIKYHPDKNPDDPNCEAKFKEIALAYATLSDPELRSKYNEFGKAKAAGGEDGVVDPEAVFSSLFGGERFVDLVGTISLGAEMKSAMQQGDEEEGEKKTADLTPEEKKKKAEEDRKQSEARAKVREERVTQLTAKLLKKLQLFTMQARGPDDEEVRDSVQKIWQIEVDDLRTESFGVEILQTLGFVYSAKAQHYMASDSTLWGVGGWFHSARSTAHVFSETWSTFKTAVEVQRVFKELSEAENKGLTDEKRKELEDKAAAKGFLAMFKVVKLDIESVTREVCERILSDPDISKEELRLRSAAMNILGGVYASVEKDESTFTLADQLKQTLSNSGTSSPTPSSNNKKQSPPPPSSKS